MLGRVAYHDPYLLAQADARLFGDEAPARSRAEVLHALVPYAQSQLARGVPLRAIARHVLGLYHGRTGGRRFRQILSDAAKLKNAGPELFLEALAAVEPVERPSVADSAICFGMSSAMYARTMLSKSASARMPSAGPSFGAKFAGHVDDDPVDRRIELPLHPIGHGVARDVGAAPRPCRRRRHEMPGTLTERVCANADAGASWPTMMLSIDRARRGAPTSSSSRATGQIASTPDERLADDAARERRRGLVRLARPHGDRRQAQLTAVDEALARHVVDEVARRSPFARRTTPAASAARRRAPDRAAGRRTPRASS